MPIIDQLKQTKAGTYIAPSAISESFSHKEVVHFLAIIHFRYSNLHIFGNKFCPAITTPLNQGRLEVKTIISAQILVPNNTALQR